MHKSELMCLCVFIVSIKHMVMLSDLYPYTMDTMYGLY